MARGRRLSSGVVNLGEEDHGPPDEELLRPNDPELVPDGDLEDAEYLRALTEIEGSDEVRWNVYCTTPQDRAGYLCTWGSTELSLERIRDEFGGGKYRVRGTFANGRYAGGRTITISGVAKPKPQAVPLAAGQDVGSLLSQLEARERERREAGSARTMEYMRILAPIMGPVMAALLGNRGPDLTAILAATRGPSLADVTQTMANLKQMQGGEETKLDHFVKMLEVAQNLGGKSGSDTNWLDILKEGLGMARPAIEGLVASAAHRLPAPSPGMMPGSTSPLSLMTTPATSPVPPTAPVSAFAGVEGDPMLRLLPWLKNQLEFLLVKAARDSDPGLYAELLIDNIPEGVAPQKILDLLSREDWWSVLSQFNSHVAPYAGWFGNLRAEIVAGLTASLRPVADTASSQEVEEGHDGS